jgi:flavin reductase (DIM6/NTAB) family NADH-FMN oxidoreductase RutF
MSGALQVAMLARLSCSVEQIVRAGDHDLVLGAVETFERRDGEPLMLHQGTFGEIRREG